MYTIKNKYTAVVVGAGSVGAMKPDKFDSPKTKNILTHAHAFYAHPQIELIGIVDNDIMKAHSAAEKWKTDAYCSLNQIKKPIDILSVCIPTEKHFKFFMMGLPPFPKMILAEKPFCNSLKESQLVMKHLNSLKIPVLINYTRRFNASYQWLKDKLNDCEIYSCVMYYDRGLVRDGSHAIDIFNYLFGECKHSFKTGGRHVDDYSKDDLTHPVYLYYNRCPFVQMIPCDGRVFSIFEMDIMTSKGRFRMTDHGRYLEVYKLENEKTYGPYKSLSTKPAIAKTNLENTLCNYVQNAIDYLEGKAQLLCAMQDAVNVHKIIQEIKG